MTNARATKPRGAVKPKAPPRPKVAPRDIPPDEVDVVDDFTALPGFINSFDDTRFDGGVPADIDPECAFPLEKDRKGRCPVTVFNAPDAWNERISFPSSERTDALEFQRGVMPVFWEEDASLVRANNPGQRTYVEADPKFGRSPLICDACYPTTRWYSTVAYQRHYRRRHGNG